MYIFFRLLDTPPNVALLSSRAIFYLRNVNLKFNTREIQNFIMSQIFALEKLNIFKEIYPKTITLFKQYFSGLLFKAVSLKTPSSSQFRRVE